MADNFKILGQADPGGSEVVLYTVPEIAATSVGNAAIITSAKASSVRTKTVVSSIIVCNRHTASVTYTIRLKKAASFDLSCTTQSGGDIRKVIVAGSTNDTSLVPVGSVLTGSTITDGSVVTSIESTSVFIIDQDATSAATADLTINADSNMEFLFYQVPLLPKKTHILSLGLTLDAGNLIEVTSGDPNKLSFTAMGIEVT